MVRCLGETGQSGKTGTPSSRMAARNFRLVLCVRCVPLPRGGRMAAQAVNLHHPNRTHANFVFGHGSFGCDGSFAGPVSQRVAR